MGNLISPPPLPSPPLSFKNYPVAQEQRSHLSTATPSTALPEHQQRHIGRGLGHIMPALSSFQVTKWLLRCSCQLVHFYWSPQGPELPQVNSNNTMVKAIIM